MPAAYRVQQFASAASSWLRPEDLAEVRHYLPEPAALELYQRMPRYDRQHARSVLAALRERDHDDPDLMAAALLHDTGKTAGQGARLRLWHRVTVVLMNALLPGSVEQAARDEPGSWRQAFAVQLNHAAIGAGLARKAGCSATTVDLILRHELAEVDPDQDPLLAALQAADGSS